MAGKRYKYSFENKNHATKGVVSAVCAGISLGIFCVASLCSLAYHGNGGIYLGAMGLTALGISIYGFVMGLRSFSEKHKNQRFSKTRMDFGSISIVVHTIGDRITLGR